MGKYKSRWSSLAFLSARLIFLSAGCSPEKSLFSAIRHRDQAKIEKLLSAGVDLNTTNRYGRTPLHHAAFCNNSEAVAALIKAGADVNAVTSRGFTPLLLAYSYYDTQRKNEITDIVSLLVAAGSDVNAAADGKIPLAGAVMWGDGEGVRLMLEAGADFQKIRINGKPLLESAEAALASCPERSKLNQMQAEICEDMPEIVEMLKAYQEKGG